MIAAVARNDQMMLNHISVGNVFTVEDQISIRLVAKANIKSHQI
jgi:hypothetical protein